MISRKAFTLVELLVVIGIIAVLTGLLLPAVSRALRRAEMVRCAAQLQQLGYALDLYAQQSRGCVVPVVYGPGNVDYDWRAELLGPAGPVGLDARSRAWPCVICPAAPEDECLSYRLNYILCWTVKISGVNRYHRPSSEIMVAAEARPDSRWAFFLAGRYDDDVEYDPHKHLDLGSNYLWLDWHVSSESQLPTVSNQETYDPAYIN